MKIEKKSNEEVEKGQEERDKSRHGKGDRRRRTQTDSQTDSRAGRKLGRGRLTVAASCTVSVSAGHHPCPLAPLSGPECQLLPSGVRLASPSHCSPARNKDEDA